MKKHTNDYEVSSGNVFADLGVANPEERLAKAELARQINTLIKQQGLTQAAAAELLSIDQPKISALSKGKLSGFSLERLFRFLNILGQAITITVAPKKRSTTKASVTVAITTPIKKSPLKKQPTSSPTSKAIHARKKSK